MSKNINMKLIHIKVIKLNPIKTKIEITQRTTDTGNTLQIKIFYPTADKQFGTNADIRNNTTKHTRKTPKTYIHFMLRKKT